MIEERVYDDTRNLTHCIRMDHKRKCLEWYGFEYDKFGNKTKYFGDKKKASKLDLKTFDLHYENNE